MACCCRPDKADKMAVSCLGRCDLPKHKCLDREDIKPGPVPKAMGWLYTARDSPEHQLRCGWRPGHISCSVLRKIEAHNCMKCGGCSTCCSSICAKPSCKRYCPPAPPRCIPLCAPSTSCAGPPCSQPLIRIVRHNGQYTITTEPSNVSNHPSGPYPLKYVLNTDENDDVPDAKYSIEAKFNDVHFDYTSSTSSFVLDFSPPEQKCYKACPKRGLPCFACQIETTSPVDQAAAAQPAAQKNTSKSHLLQIKAKK